MEVTAGLARYVEVVKDQECLRSQLLESGLVAFVADGSILPRQSGAAALPMAEDTTIPFKSPKSLRVELRKSNGELIRGMGIRRCVVEYLVASCTGQNPVCNSIDCLRVKLT